MKYVTFWGFFLKKWYVNVSIRKIVYLNFYEGFEIYWLIMSFVLGWFSISVLHSFKCKHFNIVDEWCEILYLLVKGGGGRAMLSIFIYYNIRFMEEISYIRCNSPYTLFQLMFKIITTVIQIKLTESIFLHFNKVHTQFFQ